MSIARMVEVGAAVAQAAIDGAAASPEDADAAVLRAGVLEFLRMHASRVQADGDDETLADAYREWIETAAELYSTGDESLVGEYMRRGAALTDELQLVAAQASGPAPGASSSDARAET